MGHSTSQVTEHYLASLDMDKTWEINEGPTNICFNMCSSTIFVFKLPYFQINPFSNFQIAHCKRESTSFSHFTFNPYLSTMFFNKFFT